MFLQKIGFLAIFLTVFLKSVLAAENHLSKQSLNETSNDTIANQYTWLVSTTTAETLIDQSNETSNSSTTAAATTTTTLRTTTQGPLAENEISLNSSVVIVWEKCGVEARTRITKLFQSIRYEHEITVFYDPTMNSLIFETSLSSNGEIKRDILNLPTTGSEILFFEFVESGRVLIYLDCPTISKAKLYWHSAHISSVKYLRLSKNSEPFANLDKALSTFMCRTRITTLPGTVIHFNGISAVLNASTLLFSFTYQSISFSISVQNGIIHIFSSNGVSSQISLSIPIIATNGLYLVFVNNGIQLFVSCPYNQQVAGFWETHMFDERTQIETSRVHAIGSSSSSVLLHSFCHTNGLLSNLNPNNTCLPIYQVQNTLDIIESSNNFYSQFLPTKDIIEKIESFKRLNSLNLGQLIDIEPRILFASRDYAKPKFFDRPLVEYVDGFTDGSSNFWLGLDALHKVTTAHKYKLRIVVTSNDINYVEEYNKFRVANSTDNYSLSVGVLTTGNNAYFASHDGAPFSTYDFNDKLLSRKYAAGFWHKVVGNDIENYYCFSCEKEYDQDGSSTNVYLSNAFNLKTYTTKMYLVPIDSKFEDYGLNQFLDSTILTHSSIDFLINSNAFSRADQWTLIYRGSTDGFASKNFHAKCDGKPNTLTFIKTDNSYVFGGYTNVLWDPISNYKTDTGAYIFSLINPQNRPLVMKHKSNGIQAIYCHTSYGPTFGAGHDFFISDNADSNLQSYSNLGYSYNFSLYAYQTVEAKNFLAGAYNFKVSEIEVYQKVSN